MAEDLNDYFSSVFPYAKFQGTKSGYLEQIIVTPMVVKKDIEWV